MHIHILGICGTFMGSLALLARDLGHTVTGSDANVYPPMSTQLENAGVEIISVWLETTALNFPMALCWQLFFAGPIVRFIFRHIFRRSLTADNTH